MLIILISYSYSKINDEDDINYNNFCIKFTCFIPISIIIYTFFISSTSYIFTKLKFYMDLKFISITKLLNVLEVKEISFVN